MRFFILIMIVMSLFFGGCGSKSGHPGTEDNSENTIDKIRLVWHGRADREITIAWDQRRGTDPVVCYGAEDAGSNWEAYPLTQKPTRNTVGYRGMNTHFARLTDLNANQVYYFILRDNVSTSKRYWFRTAPDKPQAFTFIAGGDSKSSGTSLEAGRLSNRMVAKLRPLFIVFNGDFCSDGTDDDQWKQWLNDWSLLTTSEDGRMYPIIPVHGNHENGDKTVLNKLFDVPYQGDNEENIYYATSFAGNFFHLIALNSEIEEGDKQRQWLEDDLKSHEHFTFKLAAYHKPFHPHTARKGEQDYQLEQWAGLFFRYGLDISMDGDSHMSKITFPIRPSDEPGSYQGFIRDDKNGTMFIGEGSWGASPRDNNDDKPWTLRSGSFNQVKWLQVFPDSDGSPAHIDIRTVITATEDEDENLVSHIEKVAALSEDDVFAVPENIDLFSPPPYGSVITFPFSE